MPSEKRQLTVSLCYATADRDVVRELHSHLTNDGVNVWLKDKDLLPGTIWKTKIETTLRRSDVVLICLSKQFNQNGPHQQELKSVLNAALEKPEDKIFIIPAQLDDGVIPQSLSHLSSVSLFKSGQFDSDEYGKLLRALRSCAEDIDAVLEKPSVSSAFPTTPPTPAHHQDVDPSVDYPNEKKSTKRLSCLAQISITFTFGIIVVVIASGFPALLSVISTSTPTPTATFTPTFTHTPTPTSAFTPSATPTLTVASCPYQGEDDDQTIRNLIEEEAIAANMGDGGMKIMDTIFSPYALIRDFAVPTSAPPKKWAGPEAHQQYNNSNGTQVRNVVHFEITPVANGITGSMATYISGSMGEYIDNTTPNWTPFRNGSKVKYPTHNGETIPATDYGSEHWVLRKDMGCWKIIQFDYNAGHIKFP